MGSAERDPAWGMPSWSTSGVGQFPGGMPSGLNLDETRSARSATNIGVTDTSDPAKSVTRSLPMGRQRSAFRLLGWAHSPFARSRAMFP